MVKRRAFVAWGLVVVACTGAGCGGDADAGSDDAASPDDAASTFDAPSPNDASVETAGDAPAESGGDAGYVEPADPAGSWRSALFPRGWLPSDLGGVPDSQGRMLPDFS